MGKWKNIILGEKMPDKDDPKYREKYEKDVEAGRKFARVTRIDRLAGHVQRFAEKHRGVFLGIVMAIVLYRPGLPRREHLPFHEGGEAPSGAEGCHPVRGAPGKPRKRAYNDSNQRERR